MTDALPQSGDPLARPTARDQGETEMSPTESLFDTAAKVAPTPATREGANRVTWVKHYAAQALAAYAAFRNEIRTLPPNPEAGSRPDLGYLILAATSSTTAVAALTDQTDYAPKLIWDLTPEAGALNGEWEEWLADTLVRYGVNPGDIDPDLDPADFTEALRTHGPSNEPFVCPDCGEIAYLHLPGCAAHAHDPIECGCELTPADAPKASRP